MGNNASSNQYEQIEHKTDFTFTYQLLRKQNEPHYGEVKLVRDIKTGEQIFLKEVVLTTKDAYQSEMAFYNKRIAVSHPNVVRIFGCTGQDQQNFCASYYKVSIFIEMLPRTLANELESRLESGIPFSENDVLLIAENLIAGLSYFEAQDIFHGDIRPENIFVSNQAYKLSDPNLYPQKNANALSQVILGQAKTLLSPQLLAQIPRGEFTISCNKFKADVFSLGATLLSLTSLSYSHEMYDYENGVLNKEMLKERLELVRKSYSKFTFELIRDMLAMEEEKRPDFITLSNRLLPYQEDIRQKGELPFFGIRAPYQEREEKFDISKYTYEEKTNPILMDFINSQLSQTATKRKFQSSERNSADSSGRVEDIMPVHDAFNGERNVPQENVRKNGNLMVEFEKTEGIEGPHYLQNQTNEQVYDDIPARNPMMGGSGQPQFEIPRWNQAQIFMQQPESQSAYVEEQGYTGRSVNMKADGIGEKYLQGQFELQTKAIPEVQSQNYLEPEPVVQQQNQMVGAQGQKPKVPLYLSESTLQTLVQNQEKAKENTKEKDSLSLDDLEAKIKAALERSEATYRRASKPSYPASPVKKQASQKDMVADVPKYSNEPVGIYALQATQQTKAYATPETLGGISLLNKGTNNMSFKPMESDNYLAATAQYVKPIGTPGLVNGGFGKSGDSNGSPQNRSDAPTNVVSTENTLYDFNPGYMSNSSGIVGGNNGYQFNGQIYGIQGGQSKSPNDYMRNVTYPAKPNGFVDNWGTQYSRANMNPFNFGTPMGGESAQRYTQNIGGSDEQKI